MEKLTRLRTPVHQTVFRTDFFDLTEGCHRFILGELHIWLTGKKREAMLGRVPELARNLGQGETIALLAPDADGWQVALDEFFNLLAHHSDVRSVLCEIGEDRDRARKVRLELAVQCLQCYRKMHRLLVEARAKRTDLN